MLFNSISSYMNIDDLKLTKRCRPTQKRARETFDLILSTAGELLEEVGFDKLNTNLICDRAGLTPPAVYRYFPNKYAVLCELGESLMERQNERLLLWLKKHENSPIGEDENYKMLLEQYQIVKSQVGGKWILRSLRSIPVLSEIRLQSNRFIVEKITARHMQRFPDSNCNRVKHLIRITSESSYAVIEMLMDIPSLNVRATLRDMARMITMMTAELEDNS